MNTETSITSRILDGEIVLTKHNGHLAIAALTEKLYATRLITGETALRHLVTATNKAGEPVPVITRGIIGTTTVEGHAITKVLVDEQEIMIPAVGRCDHFETDNHGICYACGAYVQADDAGRYL
ncbi:hypothetical protein [Agromyces larvae]|uniref:Uncharacterized protein n=1 Tax=Agromyces larvae TaxID=2929802 RepID=A0ABY4C1Z1_9MICO|nr:hypothetical protein [Agromyces larvae]UOE45457.1 hypothetical protein MTO99_06790 [Agromyces larvae]